MMEAYDQWITKKNWDHLKFLRYLLLITSLVFLLFVAWILILTINDILSPEFLRESLLDLGKGFLLGGVLGLVLGFLLLLRWYLSQEWDLHKVVPQFLFYLLIISVGSLGLSLIINSPPILETGFIIGEIMGGMLAIVAYAGEVEKEHKDNMILIEDEDEPQQ